MCGRLVLATPADAIAAEFAADSGGLALRPRWNIAPMTDIVVVRTAADGRRRLAMLRWGLVPHWARDPSIASRLINARSETAADKPSFREAMRRRRCIVPASGFYEWKREGARKQPWYFHPSRPRASLAIAGLWETWTAGDGEVLETVCLLTTAANASLAPVHDRMPVILDAEALARWLDPNETDSKALSGLLVPADDAVLAAHPVSTRVNSVRNDDPTNIEEDGPAAPSLFDGAPR